jgi:hypothetical protein
MGDGTKSTEDPAKIDVDMTEVATISAESSFRTLACANGLTPLNQPGREALRSERAPHSYEIHEGGWIASGAGGYIYTATDLDTGETVIYKCFKNTGNKANGLSWSVLRDVAFIRANPHRNIVSIRDVFVWHGRFGVVLESRV